MRTELFGDYLPQIDVHPRDDKCCFKLPLFRASPQFFNPALLSKIKTGCLIWNQSVAHFLVSLTR